MNQDRERNIKEEETFAAKQAVKQAIYGVLRQYEEPVDVIISPSARLQYDHESSQHLPKSLVGFINGIYSGRQVEIAQISTFLYRGDGGFNINIKVKPTQPIEGDSDSPNLLEGFIVFPDQKEARVNAVNLRADLTPMMYIFSIYELGSAKEIQHYGSNVSLKEDSDVTLKEHGLNSEEYLTFDLGKPVGGEINPEIVFAIAAQYRNLMDDKITTPKPRLDYSTDWNLE